MCIFSYFLIYIYIYIYIYILYVYCIYIKTKMLAKFYIYIYIYIYTRFDLNFENDLWVLPTKIARKLILNVAIAG